MNNSNNVSNNDSIINELNSTKVKELMQKLSTTQSAFSSLLNLNLKFINNITMPFENLFYNRIEVINILVLLTTYRSHLLFNLG